MKNTNTEGRDNRKDLLWRVYLMYVLVCIFSFAILFKVGKVQFVEGGHWKQVDRDRNFRPFAIEPMRGNIYSFDGSLLATSVPIFDLRMDVISDPVTDKIFYSKVDSLAFCLAGTFNHRDKDEWKSYLINARREKERYLLIKSKVDYVTLKKVRKFPIFRMGKFKGGLLVEQRSRRELPFRNLAMRTIGFSRDSVKLGIEGSFHSDLQGVKGQRWMQKIAGGIWKPINLDNEVEPENGHDIVTTIDAAVQDVAHHALEKKLIAENAKAGCAVLMEVRTGQIRAIVNLTRQDTGKYSEVLNYAIGQATEPGSTFKLMSLLAAIEDGYADTNEITDTENGTKRYFGYTMKDSHEGGYGKISLQKVFEKSSNVGTSKIIMKHYARNPQKFIDRLYSFGLNKPISLEIPGEAKPYVKDIKSKYWSGLSLPLMSIGYEEKLTPLQILTFYNSIANNGQMIKPTFVKEIRHDGKILYRSNPVVMNARVCSKETAMKGRKMLEGVVKYGTATNLKTAPYQIAAKTGTAQIAQGIGGYKNGQKISYQASLCGYFPASEPLYSCIVVVYEPSKSAYYANEVAGPVFREIADKVYSMSTSIHKAIEVDTSSGVNLLPLATSGYSDDLKIIARELNVKGSRNVGTSYSKVISHENGWSVFPMVMKNNEVPDVQGMALKDALPLLESRSLIVKVSGKGIIRRQSIPAGKICQKGMVIKIELS
jgi:cell division protein FtsI (penicillin-binding protein 3)